MTRMLFVSLWGGTFLSKKLIDAYTRNYEIPIRPVDRYVKICVYNQTDFFYKNYFL